MRLSDIRKFSIRRQMRVRFHLGNGAECVVNEHGVAGTPQFRSVPDFNLEEELAAAQDFTIESLAGKEMAARKGVKRAELEALVSAGAGRATDHTDHDE